MGRLILVSGANQSGKSAYAEGLAVRACPKRFYVATMIPRTEENLLRIAQHIRQRAGLDFQTLELPYRVGAAPVSRNSAVLLEDVSNLLSNVIFERGGTWEQVFSDICALQGRCDTLMAVTISGLDPADYCGETADYILALERLNQSLARRAELVIHMEGGQPTVEKGVEMPC